MNYRCVPWTNIIIRQGCLLINGEIDWCTVTFHVIISQSKYFKDFIRVFLVCCFLFSQTLNRALFCPSCLYYLTFFISFFLNHMGDIETGGKEDTHEDTVKWPKQFSRQHLQRMRNLALISVKQYWEKIICRDTEWEDMNKLQD